MLRRKEMTTRCDREKCCQVAGKAQLLLVERMLLLSRSITLQTSCLLLCYEMMSWQKQHWWKGCPHDNWAFLVWWALPWLENMIKVSTFFHQTFVANELYGRRKGLFLAIICLMTSLPAIWCHMHPSAGTMNAIHDSALNEFDATVSELLQ